MIIGLFVGYFKKREVKVPNVSVKSHSIIITTFTQSDEVLTRSWCHITVQFNVQITMCCLQPNITFCLGVFLNFNIFIFIFGHRIITGRSEGS